VEPAPASSAPGRGDDSRPEPDFFHALPATALLVFAASLVEFTIPARPGEEEPFDLPARLLPPRTLRPRVLDEGDGFPRNRISLRACEVWRGARASLVNFGMPADGTPPTTVSLGIQLLDDSGHPLPEEEVLVHDPAVEAPPGGRAFGSLIPRQYRGYWPEDMRVTLTGIPESVRTIDRLAVTLRVTPVRGPFVHRRRIGPRETVSLAFLNQWALVRTDEEGLVKGLHPLPGPGDAPKGAGRIQALVDTFELAEANGWSVDSAMRHDHLMIEGANLYRPSGGNRSLSFPLRAEFRGRLCGPTAICRFVLRDIPIPPAK
jgi:hypothetical protein